jgi:hypothetical protein
MAESTNGRNGPNGGWRKYFKVADLSGRLSPINGGRDQGLPGYRKNDGRGPGYAETDFSFKNYASRLPEVYSGHPNRIERYNQYENMDSDSEINACLDIIAEFSTQLNEQNKTPFEIQFLDNPTDHEIEIIKKQLQQWVKLNELDQRIFKLFRNTIKYGDQVFVRDPENFKLFWVDMSKVSRVIVNESEGKRPEQYIIRDINPNFQNLTVAAKTTTDFMVNPPTGGYMASTAYSMPNQAYDNQSRFTRAVNETCIDAKHVIHLSLNEGLDTFWPFGRSILENIFKVFKQKELLEDAILIYRVQRAPERRVFKIDVGNMPSHMAMAFVERVKNEMHQRRIPTYNGGGQSMMDSSYNPLSIGEDFFFPVGEGGRGSSVDVLQGGQQLGEIDDLKYFNNKMARGLRVPSSYLPTGPDDSERPLSDGRVGTALIQEYRFNQYCERLQALLSQKLDEEFKMFMRWRGFNIDSGLFKISFCAPQNFASYRQSELDGVRVSVFQTMEAYPYISKRFALERFLGLSLEEIQKNEEMWREERSEPELQQSSGQDLRSIGITPGGLQSDIDLGQEMANLQPGDFDQGGAIEPPGGAGVPPGAAPAAIPPPAAPPSASPGTPSPI